MEDGGASMRCHFGKQTVRVQLQPVPSHGGDDGENSGGGGGGAGGGEQQGRWQRGGDHGEFEVRCRAPSSRHYRSGPVQLSLAINARCTSARDQTSTHFLLGRLALYIPAPRSWLLLGLYFWSTRCSNFDCSPARTLCVRSHYVSLPAGYFTYYDDPHVLGLTPVMLLKTASGGKGTGSIRDANYLCPVLIPPRRLAGRCRAAPS